MSDDYKCYKCKYFDRAKHTCKSIEVNCPHEEADIFEDNEFNSNSHSPECKKTRRQHFAEMSDRELADYIYNYILNACRYCENHNKTCAGGRCGDRCIQGIMAWLQKEVGIYD